MSFDEVIAVQEADDEPPLEIGIDLGHVLVLGNEAQLETAVRGLIGEGEPVVAVSGVFRRAIFL